MSTDLTNQLRDYLDRVDPVTVEEIVEGVFVPVSPGRKRGPHLAAAVAIAVIALGGLSAVLFGQGPAVTTLPPTAGTTGPGPTATPAVHETDDLTWTVTEVPGYVAGIVETEAGLVAVISDRPYRVSAFVSQDGVGWSHLGLIDDAEFFGVQKLVSSGEVLLAFGHRWLGDEALPVWDRPAHTWVWASADGGATWSGQEMEGLFDVIAIPDGFVGAGRMEDLSQPGAIVGVTWNSRDGLTWEEAAVTNSKVGYSTDIRLIAWADGALFAVGYQSLTVNPSEIPGAVVAWSSSDGRVLEPLALEGLGGFPRKLSAAPFGFILRATVDESDEDGGVERGAHDVFYWSEDGRVWTRLPGGEGWLAADLIAADDMIYILEAQGDGPSGKARIRYSSDRLDWRTMSLPFRGGGLYRAGSSFLVTSFEFGQNGERHLLASSHSER
jgi:hypothetical protein